MPGEATSMSSPGEETVRLPPGAFGGMLAPIALIFWIAALSCGKSTGYADVLRGAMRTIGKRKLQAKG